MTLRDEQPSSRNFPAAANFSTPTARPDLQVPPMVVMAATIAASRIVREVPHK